MAATKTTTPVDEAARRKLQETAAFRLVKRARDMFVSDVDAAVKSDDECHAAKIACRIRSEYESVKHLPQPEVLKRKKDKERERAAAVAQAPSKPAASVAKPSDSMALAVAAPPKATKAAMALATTVQQEDRTRGALALRRAPKKPKPDWHPHWKLMRVISGHTGWVRCVEVEPGNEWFASGSVDRTIKIWDLASGTLRLTLTGHISTVRDIQISPRHPYLFSCGEDKTVKCWDLEQNKVIRHYHGHLSGVYTMKLHPTLDVLMTGGRDSVVRVWDMRTKAQIHCLTGHTNTVASVEAQAVDPQIISGSHDHTVKLWDLAAGKCMATLTNHKKSIRALARHPTEFTFASGAADNIKQWYLPEGKFIQNLSGHLSIVNTMAISTDNVLVSGADNGTLKFWDYRTGYCFQDHLTTPQPGSLDSENGIFNVTFDKSYSRLLTAEADKTIKVYKEDPMSTPETHPIDWKPELFRKTRY